MLRANESPCEQIAGALTFNRGEVKLRFRIFLVIFTTLLIAATGYIPGYIYSKLPVYTFIRPTQTTYTPSVRVNGTLEMKYYREVYLETPVIPSEVYVSAGDEILPGQLIARIDQERTIETVKTKQMPRQNNSDSIDIDNNLLSIANLFGVDSSIVNSIIGEYSSPVEIELTEPVNPISEIYAPVGGIVTEVNLMENNISGTGKPAVTIGERQSFMAKVTVKEDYLPEIRVGQKARVSGVGLGNRNYQAFVQNISPIAKKTIGSTSSETVVEVELKIVFPDSSLMPGLTAKGEIFTGDTRNVIMIPYEAVHQDSQNREYVYTYKDGNIIKTFIVTGAEMYSGVEIVKGLSLSDAVILTGDELGENTKAILKEAKVYG